ncbi:MAG TPA: element excision factor XisH family protein [Kofleriaceae bacterium]|nr:element excision factor XisH family protein [Kofleriaceae bacterium]
MLVRDIHHDAVVQALTADGWIITDDPLRLAYGRRDVYVDLAAELPIAAERDGQRIAVEVKSFSGASNIRELELAVGRFVVYREILARMDAQRQLYLAVTIGIYETLFHEPIGQLMIETQALKLLVFDPVIGRISRWIR